MILVWCRGLLFTTLFEEETGIRFLATDAEAVRADLATDGVDVDEVLRWPGVPVMFAFRDADGNGMEIIEQR